MRHKHADVLIAWAEGKKIQKHSAGCWEDYKECQPPVMWEDEVWRVTPTEPEVRYQWAYRVSSGKWKLSEHFYSDESEFRDLCPMFKHACESDLKRLDYTRTEFPARAYVNKS